MRVISLVPSITETLIESGVNVVGRTRFCIHPAERVVDIKVVGGTKGVDWDKCVELKPDLVIFDKEENRAEMADACPYPWEAVHIQSLQDIAPEFARLADRVESQSLAQSVEDWCASISAPKLSQANWEDVPGQIESLNNELDNYKRIEYVIWRDPWMAVSRNTFVGSMLGQLGFEDLLPSHPTKYPVLKEADMRRSDTFYLFSSEPYRFGRCAKKLKDEGFNGAIVDGEVYSWFGTRSMKALSAFLG